MDRDVAHEHDGVKLGVERVDLRVELANGRAVIGARGSGSTLPLHAGLGSPLGVARAYRASDCGSGPAIAFVMHIAMCSPIAVARFICASSSLGVGCHSFCTVIAQ